MTASTTSPDHPTEHAVASAGRPADPRRALRALVVNEARLLSREPFLLFWTIAFPVILLSILGGVSHGEAPDPDLGGLRTVDVYTPIVIAMAFTMLGSFTLPPTLGSYRELGVLRRLATTPLGARRVLVAQAIVLGTVALSVSVLVLAVGRIAFGVALPGDGAGFLVACVLTAASLFALGLLIAALAPTAKAAAAAGGASFFPLMFFGGLWFPRELMPSLLRDIGEATPLGAGVQAMSDAAAGKFPGAVSLLVLLAWTAACGVAAARLFRWQ